MFQKLLVANRGEIAVRIIRTCREMGIPTVALYEPADIASLHVRLADECVALEHPDGFFARDEIVRLALQAGADALHPGYGFLAERPDFIDACQQAGVHVIGPLAETVAILRDRVHALEIAGRAGIATMAFAALDLQDLDLDNPAHRAAVQTQAQQLGYPLVIKPGSGGSGKGERIVCRPDQLLPALRHTVAAARSAFCAGCVYLEKAVFPAHSVTVLVLSDGQGRRLSLGECQAYLFPGSQKLIEETPAPCLDQGQRQSLNRTAVSLARLFRVTGLVGISFVVDPAGQAYFTEIKAHLPVEHPLFEMLHRIDLVREQIRLAAGWRLRLEQSRLPASGAGVALLCRVNAEDPGQSFLPSPGRVLQARFPGGHEVRVDSYIYSGCEVPGLYDSLIAKLAVWDEDRPACLRRMRRALKDFKLTGIHTNLALLKERLQVGDFVDGRYACLPAAQPCRSGQAGDGDRSEVSANETAAAETSGAETSAADRQRQDLAVIASLLYQQRLQMPVPGRGERYHPSPAHNHKSR